MEGTKKEGAKETGLGQAGKCIKNHYVYNYMYSIIFILVSSLTMADRPCGHCGHSRVCSRNGDVPRTHAVTTLRINHSRVVTIYYTTWSHSPCSTQPPSPTPFRVTGATIIGWVNVSIHIIIYSIYTMYVRIRA